MKTFLSKAKRFMESEDGPTAVEYSIMLALIVMVCIAAIQAIGTNTNSAFTDLSADLDSARNMGGL